MIGVFRSANRRRGTACKAAVLFQSLSISPLTAKLEAESRLDCGSQKILLTLAWPTNAETVISESAQYPHVESDAEEVMRPQPVTPAWRPTGDCDDMYVEIRGRALFARGHHMQGWRTGHLNPVASHASVEQSHHTIMKASQGALPVGQRERGCDHHLISVSPSINYS